MVAIIGKFLLFFFIFFTFVFWLGFQPSPNFLLPLCLSKSKACLLYLHFYTDSPTKKHTYTHTHASTYSLMSVFPVCFYANGIFHISLLSVIYLICLCHLPLPILNIRMAPKANCIRYTTRISFIISSFCKRISEHCTGNCVWDIISMWVPFPKGQLKFKTFVLRNLPVDTSIILNLIPNSG